MAFENTLRAALADEVCAYLRTPSVEDMCISYANGTNFGFAATEEAFRKAQGRAMVHLYTWMLAHGWTDGEVPDFDALILEL